MIQAGEHGSADRLTEELYKAKDAAYLVTHAFIERANLGGIGMNMVKGVCLVTCLV